MIPVMARRPWSFKEDRRLMELAKSSTSLEEAAKVLGRSPDAVKRMALRLGLLLKSKGTKKS
jgi:predicted transcriptional regulator